MEEDKKELTAEQKLENDKKIVAYLNKTGTKAHLAPADANGKYSLVIDYWLQWKQPIKIETAYVDSIARELPVVKTEADAVMYALERFGWHETYVIRKSAIDAVIAAGKSTFSIDEIPCESYLYFNLLRAKVIVLEN